MAYQLPTLHYAYDALEPYIDARTMEIHYTKHHQAYITNLNKALEGRPGMAGMTVDDLVASIENVPEEIRTVVRNHGGGHANHSLFWTVLKRDEGQPRAELSRAIEEHLGGFDAFRQSFTNAAMTRFGSGWAWLSVDENRRLVVESTPNQNSPLMHGNIPILGIDVWEHAYYLKYQNRRNEYVDAFYHVIDWNAVTERYVNALSQAGQAAQLASR